MSKAVEALKREQTPRPASRETGAMIDDDRLMDWKEPAHLSLLTLQAREVVAMIDGDDQAGSRPRLEGQCDRVYRDGRFYLLATMHLPEAPPTLPWRFIGVHLGRVNLAADSDGNTYMVRKAQRAKQHHWGFR